MKQTKRKIKHSILSVAELAIVKGGSGSDAGSGSGAGTGSGSGSGSSVTSSSSIAACW